MRNNHLNLLALRSVVDEAKQNGWMVCLSPTTLDTLLKKAEASALSVPTVPSQEPIYQTVTFPAK